MNQTLMRLLAVVLAACLVSSAVASPSLFNAFQRKFKKFYDVDEYMQRYQVFMQNLQAADELNNRQAAFAASEVAGSNNPDRARFGVNEFSDMTPAEFKRNYLLLEGSIAGGLSEEARREAESAEIQPSTNQREARAIPTKFDWRYYNRSVLTPVKNQGACGSCWAHAVVQSVESQWALAGNPLISLSKQQIIDCDPNDNGCNGGWPTRGFTYVVNAGGVQAAAAYPHTGTKGTCRFDKTQVVAKIKGYTTISTTKDEAAMANFVATKGPLSVCLDAGIWQYYTGGVITTSSGCGMVTNHCVTVTGYNVTSSGMPVWNVRNSWGPTWAEQGYLRIQRGANVCNIASNPTAAVV